MLYLVSSVCYIPIELGRNTILCYITKKTHLIPGKTGRQRNGHSMGYSQKPYQTFNLGVSEEQL